MHTCTTSSLFILTRVYYTTVLLLAKRRTVATEEIYKLINLILNSSLINNCVNNCYWHSLHFLQNIDLHTSLLVKNFQRRKKRERNEKVTSIISVLYKVVDSDGIVPRSNLSSGIGDVNDKWWTEYVLGEKNSAWCSKMLWLELKLSKVLFIFLTEMSNL